jgi:hypothetical protein
MNPIIQAAQMLRRAHRSAVDDLSPAERVDIVRELRNWVEALSEPDTPASSSGVLADLRDGRPTT